MNKTVTLSLKYITFVLHWLCTNILVNILIFISFAFFFYFSFICLFSKKKCQ